MRSFWYEKRDAVNLLPSFHYKFTILEAVLFNPLSDRGRMSERIVILKIGIFLKALLYSHFQNALVYQIITVNFTRHFYKTSHFFKMIFTVLMSYWLGRTLFRQCHQCILRQKVNTVTLYSHLLISPERERNS